MLTASESTMPPTMATAPKAPLPPSPDSTLVAMVATPRIVSAVSERHNRLRKLGRRRKGTFHTVLSALCIAWTTPNPAHRDRTMPMVRATPLPRSEPFRSDQEPDDDERDAGEDTASDQRDDPGDHQHHRDDPQDRGHTAAARPGQQSNHRFSSFSVMPTPLVMTFEKTDPTDIGRSAL